jgi:hypothetical protein
VVVGFAGKQLAHFHLSQAWVSKSKGILASTDLPMSELTSFIKVRELNLLPFFSDWTCALHPMFGWLSLGQ